MSTIIAMHNGKPTIFLFHGTQYTNAADEKISAQTAWEMIQGNTAGDPTKMAVYVGLISRSWPYRLADETEQEFEERIGQ